MRLLLVFFQCCRVFAVSVLSVPRLFLVFALSLPSLGRVLTCCGRGLACRQCCAFAVALPSRTPPFSNMLCFCRVFAVSLLCLALFLPRRGRGLSCFCNVFAVSLPCVCFVCAVFLQSLCRVFAVSSPWLGRMLLCHCRDFAVSLLRSCRCLAVWQWFSGFGMYILHKTM